MDEAAKAVPPFIPGLLVVFLLITISLLIWWRNYVRRTNPSSIPGVDGWEYWDGDLMDDRRFAKLEKPKLWEVGVGLRDVDQNSVDETRWEKMSPLSATSITPESSASESSQIPHAPQTSRTRKLIPSRFRRPKFISPLAPAPPSSSQASSPVPLQVSVLILMPSLDARLRSRSRESPSPSLPHPGLHSNLPGKIFEEENEEEEGSPDVAFGVVVLPWRKAEMEVEETKDN